MASTQELLEQSAATVLKLQYPDLVLVISARMQEILKMTQEQRRERYNQAIETVKAYNEYRAKNPEHKHVALRDISALIDAHLLNTPGFWKRAAEFIVREGTKELQKMQLESAECGTLH